MLHGERMLLPECLRCRRVRRGLPAGLPGVRSGLLPRRLLHCRRLRSRLRGLWRRPRLPHVRGGRSRLRQRDLRPRHHPNSDCYGHSDCYLFLDSYCYLNCDRNPHRHPATLRGEWGRVRSG